MMDTSETYVKMCEKAVEIQVLAKLFEKDQYSFWVCSKWHLPVHSGRFFSDDIWLPRQDQLQEMVIPPYKNFLNAFFFFHDFLFEQMTDGEGDIPEPYKFNSMEQLWLAFVMKEKYGKTWNGEDWDKSDKFVKVV